MQAKKEGQINMQPLKVFAYRFGAELTLDITNVIEKSQRYYLLNPSLENFAPRNFYYAGLYLGKVRDRVFFPSFNFLNILLNSAKNLVIVNEKAAWLFVCGRDVFQEGIEEIKGSKQKGGFSLVLNQYGECLGFGVVVDFGGRSHNKVVVRNLLDIGDFLRRER
jgi:ribosome biogenesis protein Nip4